MITYVDATDEMFGIVKSVVLDDPRWHALLGYDIDVRWPGDAKASKPDVTRLWARVSKQVVKDSQTALANANEERVFETIGLLYVQLFCPRNQPATLQNGTQIALALQAAFRKQSPSGEVWFLNQVVRELAEGVENYPINVVTEFRYKTLDPINVLKGEGVLTQRTIAKIDVRHFSIGGSPSSLLWYVNGLAQSVPEQYSYDNGIVTTTFDVPNDAPLLAIGE